MAGDQSAQEFDKLNPTVAPVQEQQFLNYSKLGALPNITGDLFKEIGDITKTAVTGLDTFFKERIRGEATAQVDNERDRTQNWLQGGDAPENVKNSVNANRTLVNNLQTAANQGQISQAYYQMRLDTIARDMRSRYPGYREHIDNVISDLTGGVPANKIITDLFHASTNKADLESKMLEHTLKKITDDVPSGADWLAQYRQKNGIAPPLNEALIFFGKYQQSERGMKLASEQLKLDQEMGKADEHQVGRMALATFRANSSKDLQKNNAIFSKFNDLLEDAQKNLDATGGALNPEKQKQLLLAANNMEQLLMSHAQGAIREWSNKPGDNKKGYLTTEDTKKIQEEAQMMSNLIKTGLGDGGKLLPGVLGAVKNHLTAMSEFDQNNIMQDPKNSVVRTVAAIHKIGIPDQTLNAGLLAGNNGVVFGAAVVNVANLLKAQAMGGLTSMTDASEFIKQAIPSDPKAHGPVLKDTIDSARKVLMDPDNPKPEGSAKFLFDPAAVRNMKSSDRSKYYAEMSSPEVLNRMIEIKKQGKGELFDQYAKFVYDTGSVLARPEIQTIAKINENNKSGYSVVFDPKTLTFTSEAKAGYRGLLDPASTGATVTDRLNRLTAPMINAMKEQGLSTDAIQFKLQETFAVGNFNLQDITKQEEGKGEKPVVKGTPNFRAPAIKDQSKVPSFPEGTLTKEDQAVRAPNDYSTTDLHIAKVNGKYVIIPNSMKRSEIADYLKSYADPAAGMAFDDPQMAIKRMEILQKGRDRGLKSFGAQ